MPTESQGHRDLTSPHVSSPAALSRLQTHELERQRVWDTSRLLSPTKSSNSLISCANSAAESSPAACPECHPEVLREIRTEKGQNKNLRAASQALGHPHGTRPHPCSTGCRRTLFIPISPPGLSSATSEAVASTQRLPPLDLPSPAPTFHAAIRNYTEGPRPRDAPDPL